MSPPNDKKPPLDDLDDWASAIDEWDSNLALPEGPPVPQREPDKLKPAQPVVKPTAQPNTGASSDEPAPLDAAPLDALPAADPLMSLFDGEMDLPEEAGEALGSLLGTNPGASGEEQGKLTNPVEFDTPGGEMEMEAAFGDFSTGESTRVAPADEVSALLDDLDELEPSGKSPEPAPVAAAPAPTPVKKQSSLRMPTVIEEPAEDELPDADESLNEFSSGESTRVASSDDIEALLGGLPELEDEPTPPPQPPPKKIPSVKVVAPVMPAPPVPRPMEDSGSLEIDVEPAKPPPATDDEFYDDISIEAAREEASQKVAAPAPRPVEPERSDPILVEPPIAARADRASDPDRTPLPISEEIDIDEGLFDAGPPTAIGGEVAPSRPVEAARISAAIEAVPSALSVPEQSDAHSLEGGYLRDQLAFFDTERILQEPPRAAKLAYAAGRVCEKLGDDDAAIERYEAALEADPGSQMALRALRKLRLRKGESDKVLAMLDREKERATAQEKRALDGLRAELSLARGDRDLAREAYEDLLEQRPDDPGAALGLVDVAATDGGDELSTALARAAESLSGSTDARSRAQLAVERGRLDEAGGRVRDAVARYRDALQLDSQAVGALWGLLRVAVRTPGETDDLDTHARLVELLPRGPLRTAVERRLGILRLRAGDPAGARPPLQQAAADGDVLALRALLGLERAEGRLDEAAAALARLVEVEQDPGRRADLLVQLGQLHEERSSTAQAQAAYSRAAQEYPEDPRAQRALERTQAAGGDKQSALDRHLVAADRDAHRAPLEWTRAARLYDELGRRDDALERVRAALAKQPGFAPAVELAVELELAGGQADAAAGVLLSAAEAVDDQSTASALRERAVRLYAKAGRRDDAVTALQPLLGLEDSLPYRWLNERLLAMEPPEPAALADSLESEADLPDTEPARAAALLHRRGLLLSTSDPEQALEAQRRALALDGNFGAAAVEVAALKLSSGQGRELPAVWKARLEASGERPERVALALRLATAWADEASDFAEAQRAAGEAGKRAADDPAVRDAVVRTARLAGDTGALVQALEQELERTTDPAARFALLVVLGEKLEPQKPDKAADRYRQALELRARHPVAQQALERSLEAAKNHAVLADLALNDLKEAQDSPTKVRAYERLAYIDGELRGDAESALLGFESIMEVDHANHRAMRVLENKYLKEGSFGDLVRLYDQMGLTATDPTFAAAIHLDRARLRHLARPGVATDGENADAELRAAVDNDYRLALFKDPHSRPALRHTLARARQTNDLSQIAEVSTALADSVGDDGRTAAVCLTRAAEALVDLERADEATQKFQLAGERGGLHLPALAGLLDLSLVRGEYAAAVDAAERQGQALKNEDGRAGAYLLAGAIADEHLKDLDRALGDLRQALSIEPRSLEAFERLKSVLERRGDFAALGELYRQRLDVETDGLRLTSLHLELARIARDQLQDKERARAELRAVLEQDAAHPEALQILADLYYDDGQWTEAAETLIKRARIEKTREALKDIFFKLGIIYADKQPDPKRAIASFTRVLKADPNHLIALEHLSNLFLKEWEWKGALEATARLAELEKDRPKKTSHLLRVAKIYEEGFKDARHALEAYRAALDIDPMNLTSIGELSRFFDRQSDVQSMRVHLDRAAARVRSVLDKDIWDVPAYHSLFKIFGWRRAPDRAAMAAGVLEHLGQANEEEKAILQKAMAREPYPGSALADPSLDESLYDARVPAGFRHLFRLLDEPLTKLFRADIRKLGLGKNDKLPARGHAVRDLANRIAADLGVRDFDLYVTAQHPTALMVELTEPLSIILGSKLIEGAHEHEMRFYFGRALKMMQAHMSLPMRLSSEDLGVLVGAIVRQFVPDFVPKGFEEAQIAGEAARLSKLIPKKMQAELFPFAMECASPSLDLKMIGPALLDTANRAGLLACGMMAPALKAVRRLDDEAQVRWLIRFAMGEDVAELRRLAGTSIG